MSRTLGVIAFYKADTPIGITIEYDCTVNPDKFTRFKNNILDLQNKKIEDPGNLFTLLNSYGKYIENIPSEILLRLVVVIAWLEGQGFIDTDEYNGVVWMEDGKTVVPKKRKAWRFVD